MIQLREVNDYWEMSADYLKGKKKTMNVFRLLSYELFMLLMFQGNVRANATYTVLGRVLTSESTAIFFFFK